MGIYPQGANNIPFTAAYFQSKGDPITDLTEDMAAEGAYKKEQRKRKMKKPYYQSTTLIIIRAVINWQFIYVWFTGHD